MAAPAALLLLLAQQAMAQQNPGQPTKSGRGGTFEVVGESGVSAQMLFLGTTNKVYIVDKTENNPAQVAGHPAWATEYDLTTNLYRTMDIRTNAFCAGGATLGDGTWLNVGGNEAILAGGDPVTDGSGGPYNTVDGRRAVRTLTPCDDESCQWVDDPANYMSGERWYPTLEPLEDGRVIIIGGHARGGFVNDAVNNVPTYEFFPRNGEPTIELDLLKDTLPANLFPLTWLLPSGRLFVQLNYGTYILDYKNAAQRETRLADMPHAVRTYPASAASLLLPLTPANNYRATFMFCGGTDLQPTEWNPDTNLAQHPADNSCVKITPEDPNPAYEDDPDEYLPVGRVMGSAIILPTGQIVVLNGANKGVAGYGKQAWVIGQSYADEPLLRPLIYSPDKPPAERWSDADFQDSTVERMYHSSATLLPDGSIFVSGSNPNADVVPAGGPRFVTEYAVERFYPMYYDKRRPEPRNLPNSLSYGGAYFNVSLSNEDLEGSLNNLNSVKAVIIRAGFSTHAMNMGQRMLQLETTYTGNADGSATLHVSQLPPNPALFAPGPALMFVVVNDVPSVGVQVMIGNGRIGAQTTTDNAALPTSFIPEGAAGGSGGGSNGGGNGGGNNNGAISFGVSSSLAVAAVLGLFALLA